MPNRLTETVYGFVWGPVAVQRIVSDPKWGFVLRVDTLRQSVQLRITPSGLIRIEGAEGCPPGDVRDLLESRAAAMRDYPNLARAVGAVGRKGDR